MADQKKSNVKSAPAPSIVRLDELGWLGHGLPAALGLAALIAAFFAYQSHIQITLTVALLVIGGLLPWVTWLSLHGSRAGWSFLLSLSIVLGVMTLFGAPKVRGALDVSLWLTMILPGLNVVAAAALISLRAEYLERDTVQA